MSPSLDPHTLDLWLQTARDAAAAAAQVHRRWSGRIDIRSADHKGFSDFVSRVDTESQDAALEVIQRSHPDHLILAEEGEPEVTRIPAAGTPLWVVDPLDGTTNYLHGHPSHAASVAVTVDGKPLAACVHAAATGECWWARAGGGSFRNGRPVRVSAPRGWEQSLVATGFMFRGANDLDAFTAQMGRVKAAGAGIRRCGAAALDLCYVADGRYEGFWEHFLNPWDYAAGWLLVEEAGGVTGRMEGGRMELGAGSIMAANTATTLQGLRELLEVAGVGGLETELEP
ncbi:MAG: inositol monophosphatase [Gemmatimonadales bacterium]|jgi:myo-inositol-1(or 4)-monophosphatase|nr:MAG: inositol monophosphatase [Gemmatimonadales bacterium]